MSIFIFSKVRANVKAHDRVAGSYETSHGEIFNHVEQARLRAKLEESADLITSPEGRKKALDVGCGNLTAHLLGLGFSVTAADISGEFLRLIKTKFKNYPRLETARLNGLNLSGFSDGTFQFTAAYSVLHHVADYLGMVREMARVTAGGGILYIDHESQPGYWDPGPEYAAFLKEAAPPPAKPPLARFLRFSTYVNKIKLLMNPRYIAEGDIHVWPDDHIEWEAIGKVLEECGLEPVLTEDYLLYRHGYNYAAYARYRGRCSDTRMLAARKR